MNVTKEKRAFGASFPIPHLKRYFSLEIVLWDTDIRKLVEAWRSKQRWLEWGEFTYVSSESKFFRRAETYLAMVKCSHFPKESVIEVGSLHALAPFLFRWWATCNVRSEKQNTHLSHETDTQMSTILRVEWRDRAQLTYRSGKARLEWDSSPFDSLGVSPHSSWDFLPRHSRRAALSHSICRMSTKVLPHSPSFLTIPENSNTNRKCRVRWAIQWQIVSNVASQTYLTQSSYFHIAVWHKSFSPVHGTSSKF